MLKYWIFFTFITLSISKSTSITTSIITLKDSNFVSIRGPITSGSITTVLTTLIDKVSSLEDDDIYIYINSPGGSVDAGMQLVTYIESLKEQNIVVNCIAENAMSMGFLIFQYCDNRYITKYATLMQHQMSLGNIKGKIKEINSYIEYINLMEDKINLDQATRIGLSIDEFNTKINNDWWLYSTNIIENKVADKVVSIKCNFRNYQETITIQSIFGEISVIYSRCPTISAPIKIIFPDIDKNDENLITASFTNNINIIKSPRYFDRLIEIVQPRFF